MTDLDGGLDTSALKRSIRGRLKEVDRELASVQALLAERERLEAALARLDDATGRPPATGRRRGRATTSRSPSRRRAGETRQLVVSFLTEHGGAATAAEVSAATGLKRSSVATLMSTLAKESSLEKRERGYAVP